MKKVPAEKITKIQQSDETKNSFKEFFGSGSFMFALKASADNVVFTTEVPTLNQIKQKIILILRARNDKSAPEVNEHNVSKEVVMMEVNRQILENLYLLCQEVYLPVLGNPAN